MITLGITHTHGDAGAHDSSAAIVRDGVIVAAVEEERFTRRKHDAAFPLHAIDFCLREAGVTLRELDAIVIPELPFRYGAASPLAEVDLAFLRTLRPRAALPLLARKGASSFLGRFAPAHDGGMREEYRFALEALRSRHGELPAVRFYPHHQCHAAAAVLPAGVRDAVAVTADNVGGLFSTVAWRYHGGVFTRLRAEAYDNSLGRYYESCTMYAGLGEFGEGKFMGLASYGTPDTFADRLARILSVEEETWFRHLAPPTPTTIGIAPADHPPTPDSAWADFAAAVQDRLEAALRRITGWALAESPSACLCLGGGVALNCSANGALLRAHAGREVYVFPAAGDAGLSVGAALLGGMEAAAAGPRVDAVYLGPGYTADECLAALQDAEGIAYRRTDDPARDGAELIADGKVIGWFQGRMEFGPRALGNRSILADPRTIAMRDRVNDIKHRERWRPLAPVVLAERAGAFFELSQESPFMLIAAPVRAEARGRIPAVVHVDGSARPQTVRADQNARLHGLLTHLERLTGIPVALNTSFNDADEPIVCSPSDAIRSFRRMALDALVLGDFVVTKRTPGPG